MTRTEAPARTAPRGRLTLSRERVDRIRWRECLDQIWDAAETAERTSLTVLRPTGGREAAQPHGRPAHRSGDYDFELATDATTGLVLSYGDDLWRAAATAFGQPKDANLA